MAKALDPANDKRKQKRVSLNSELYEFLAREAMRGGFIPLNSPQKRNAVKDGIEALLNNAKEAIEYHVDDVLSIED